ncbi:pyridoxal-phosphate dependent enzyme [Actinophytocola sp.]|uniref:threonine synthase n=1 Tax=Actinophytocola sp. TaxID=1872138 RepID=UPI0038999426
MARPRYVCDCPATGRLDYVPGSDAGRLSRDELLGAAGTGLWRYADLLPIPADDPAARTVGACFPVGGTPLHRAGRVADRLGAGEVWIKNEAANPSGSLKDRASAVVLAAALRSGARVIAGASTGNAAAATAAVCAAVGFPFVAFLPAHAPVGRLDELVRYGATVLLVDGDYEAAVRLSLAACDEWGWFCRTSAVNPYTTQGKKTVALEILDQLGWSVPDVVVAPCGDGNVLVGLHHGFRDALERGWVDRMPRLVAVQAAGAPAIFLAWAAGATEVAPAPAATVADGINVSRPLDGTRALAALRETGGVAVTVPDEAILAARDAIAAECGIPAEPSSAASFAALPGLVATGVIGASDRVVVLNTGAGSRSSGGDTTGVFRVPEDLAAVRAAVGDLAAARLPDRPSLSPLGI